MKGTQTLPASCCKNLLLKILSEEDLRVQSELKHSNECSVMTTPYPAVSPLKGQQMLPVIYLSCSSCAILSEAAALIFTMQLQETSTQLSFLLRFLHKTPTAPLSASPLGGNAATCIAQLMAGQHIYPNSWQR